MYHSSEVITTTASDDTAGGPPHSNHTATTNVVVVTNADNGDSDTAEVDNGDSVKENGDASSILSPQGSPEHSGGDKEEEEEQEEQEQEQQQELPPPPPPKRPDSLDAVAKREVDEALSHAEVGFVLKCSVWLLIKKTVTQL